MVVPPETPRRECCAAANPRRAGAEVTSAPTWDRTVYAESPEVVAGMPELTHRQQALFERLRHEGTVVLGGRERKTLEALVRRGIATYEAEYVLNEKHSYYAYRFTVRLKLEAHREVDTVADGNDN